METTRSPRHSTAAFGAWAVFLVVAATACASGTAPTAAERAPGTTAPSNTSGTASTGVGVKHYFIINLENESFGTTFGPTSPANYLNTTLVPQGKLLSQYHGIGHNSLDNYLAEISGQAPNPDTQADCLRFSEFDQQGTAPLGQAIGRGCVYPASVPTIAQQLDAKGLTWKGYMEDMANDPQAPKTCRHPDIGQADRTQVARNGDQYATRHDPFVYFHGIIDSPECQANVVALGALDADLQAGSTPNYAFITPSLCHDGHDEPCVDGEPGGLASADQFLQTWVPKITGSAAFKDGGVLVITFDEAETRGDDADSSSCCNELPGPNVDQPGGNGPGGGRIGALVLSPLVRPGTSDVPYNHYSLLCSVEQAFGLDRLGMAGADGLACFGPDVFDQPRPTG
jgi:hypothetical protein